MKGTYDSLGVSFSVSLRDEVFNSNGENLSQGIRPVKDRIYGDLERTIRDSEKESVYAFEGVYGANPQNLFQQLELIGVELAVPMLTLIGKRFIPSSNGSNAEERSEFVNIPFEGKATFEDAIRDYLTANYGSFDTVQKLHALCFLQRYCMSYEDVKDIKEGTSKQRC